MDGPSSRDLAASLAGSVDADFFGRFLEHSCDSRASSGFSASFCFWSLCFRIVLGVRLIVVEEKNWCEDVYRDKPVVLDVHLIVEEEKNWCEDVYCDKQVLCG